MPSLRIPTIQATALASAGGSNATVNAAVHPLLLVRDGNGKMTQVRGASFQMADVTPPAAVSFAVEQVPGSYSFRPTAGSVSDNASGTLDVYHFLASSTLSVAAATAVLVNPANASHLGHHALTDYAAGAQVELAPAAAALTVGDVCTVTAVGSGWTVAWAPVSEASAGLVPTLAVRDNFGRYAAYVLVARAAADRTPPAFGGAALELGQGSSNYTFSVASASTVSDSSVSYDNGGALRSFLLLATAPFADAAALKAAFGGSTVGLVAVLQYGLDAGAKRTADPYVAGAALSLTGMGSSRYYDATADTFANVDETHPQSPFSLYPHVVAVDESGNVGMTASAAVTVTVHDWTPATVAAVAVTQGSGDYTLTISNAECAIADGRSGALAACLVLADRALNLDELRAIPSASISASAVYNNSAYVGGTSVPLAGVLSTGQFYKTAGATNAMTAVTDAIAAQTLYPHLLVVDPNGNAAKSPTATAVSVVDHTRPVLSGSLALTQTSGTAYTFSATGVSFVEWRAASLPVGLFLSKSALNDAQVAVVFNAGANVTKTSVSNAGTQGTAVPVTVMTTAAYYYDAGAWTPVSDKLASLSLYAYQIVYDSNGNYSVASQSDVTVTDYTVPVLSGALLMTQTPSAYTFANSGVSFVEWRAASLPVGVFLSKAALSDAQAAALYVAGTNVTKVAVANASQGATVPVTTMTTSAYYYDAGAWTAVSDKLASISLLAYLVVYDSAGNYSVASQATVTVADVTPPALFGALALAQTQNEYTFAATGMSFVEWRSAAVPVGLFLSKSTLSDAQAAALYVVGANVTKTTVANASQGAAVAVPSMLSSAYYYDLPSASWIAVSDKLASISLYGYQVVYDGVGNYSVTATALAAAVADYTAPTLSGALSMAQTVDAYTFTGSGVSFVEWRAASLPVGMFMSKGALTAAQADALYTAGTNVTKTDVANASQGATVAVPSMVSSALYYDVSSTSWIATSDRLASISLYANMVVYDGSGKYSVTATSSVAVTDYTAPTLSGSLNMAQTSEAYTFTSSGVSFVEWRAASLPVGLFMAKAALTAAQADALYVAGTNITKVSVANASQGASVTVTPMVTVANYYDDGTSAWVPVTDKLTSTPLYAHMVVYDGNGKYSVMSNPSVAVSDFSAPALSGTLTAVQTTAPTPAYSFTVSGASAVEWRSASLPVGAFMSKTTLTNAQAAALYAAGTNVTKDTVANPSQGVSVAVTSMVSATDYYDLATASWIAVSDRAASTPLYAHLIVYDGNNEYAVTVSASVAVTDITPPALSGTLALAQTSGSAYTFAASGVSAVEWRAATLSVGLFLSKAALSDATVYTVYGAAATQYVAKNSVSNPSPGSTVTVPSMTSTAYYYDAGSWVAVTDQASSTPLYAYMAVIDGTGNYSAISNAAVAVTDYTAPVWSSLTAAGSSGSISFAYTATDGRAVATIGFYANDVLLGSISPAAATATGTQAYSLDAGTYSAYAIAYDAAGNSISSADSITISNVVVLQNRTVTVNGISGGQYYWTKTANDSWSAPLSGGQIVNVWVSHATGGTLCGVFAQVVSAAGAALTPVTTIKDDGVNSYVLPTVCALDDGAFVIAHQLYVGGATNLYYSICAFTGSTITFTNYTLGTQTQDVNAKVTVRRFDGTRFILAWVDYYMQPQYQNQCSTCGRVQCCNNNHVGWYYYYNVRYNILNTSNVSSSSGSVFENNDTNSHVQKVCLADVCVTANTFVFVWQYYDHIYARGFTSSTYAGLWGTIDVDNSTYASLPNWTVAYPFPTVAPSLTANNVVISWFHNTYFDGSNVNRVLITEVNNAGAIVVNTAMVNPASEAVITWFNPGRARVYRNAAGGYDLFVVRMSNAVTPNRDMYLYKYTLNAALALTAETSTKYTVNLIESVGSPVSIVQLANQTYVESRITTSTVLAAETGDFGVGISTVAIV